MPHDREINDDVYTIDWMVSSMVYAVVDSMVDFDVNSRLELWKLEIIDAHTQARFVYRFKKLSNGWRRGRLRAADCQHQTKNHCCRQTRFVCLTSSECPTNVKWIWMSARLIEWSSEWLTQLLIEWLTSTSAADWKCQGWKSLMQTRRIALSIYLKIHPMVDAEVDWEVDWTVDSMVQ